MGGLKELSEDIAAIARSLDPVVVRVRGRRRWASSGIAIEPDAVVTADHTLDSDEGITVVLPDGREIEAEVAGSDPRTDLAVLKVPGARLAEAPWDSEAQFQAGHLAVAVGRPGDVAWVSLAAISAVGPQWRTSAGGMIERYIQLDVAPYPGLSGSAVADASGKILGLATTGLLRGFQLALPARTIQRVAHDLLTRGTVRRGYLGVTGQPVRLPQAVASEAKADRGVLISSVQAQSPAERAGLLLGDTLVELGGQQVASLGDLLEILEDLSAKADAPARIVRAGQVQELAIRLGESQGG